MELGPGASSHGDPWVETYQSEIESDQFDIISLEGFIKAHPLLKSQSKLYQQLTTVNPAVASDFLRLFLLGFYSDFDSFNTTDFLNELVEQKILQFNKNSPKSFFVHQYLSDNSGPNDFINDVCGTLGFSGQEVYPFGQKIIARWNRFYPFFQKRQDALQAIVTQNTEKYRQALESMGQILFENGMPEGGFNSTVMKVLGPVFCSNQTFWSPVSGSITDCLECAITPKVLQTHFPLASDGQWMSGLKVRVVPLLDGSDNKIEAINQSVDLNAFRQKPYEGRLTVASFEKLSDLQKKQWYQFPLFLEDIINFKDTLCLLPQISSLLPSEESLSAMEAYFQNQSDQMEYYLLQTIRENVGFAQTQLQVDH
jgi:hypothetical protein